MDNETIEAWTRWALPASVETVVEASVLALHDWSTRMRTRLEQCDAADWAGHVPFPLFAVDPPSAAQAAAHAAGEVAIVVACWPDRLDEILPE